MWFFYYFFLLLGDHIEIKTRFQTVAVVSCFIDSGDCFNLLPLRYGKHSRAATGPWTLQRAHQRNGSDNDLLIERDAECFMHIRTTHASCRVAAAALLALQRRPADDLHSQVNWFPLRAGTQSSSAADQSGKCSPQFPFGNVKYIKRSFSCDFLQGPTVAWEKSKIDIGYIYIRSLLHVWTR